VASRQHIPCAQEGAPRPDALGRVVAIAPDTTSTGGGPTGASPSSSRPR
jgi:hypothetical protein